MTLDGRNFLAGPARQRALTEYWNDPNNNENLPGWASIRTAAYQYTEYYDIANRRPSPSASTTTSPPTPMSWSTCWPTATRPTTPTPPPLAQTLRADRQCAGGGCP